MKKINVLLVFGGQSFEHDISILSAKNLYPFFDKKKYKLFLLFINKQGKWFFVKNKILKKKKYFQNFQKYSKLLEKQDKFVISGNGIISKDNKIDVIFPLLHGKIGEDGSFQGFCNVINTPCVGPNVIGASIGFDKEFTKKILQINNIPTSNFITLQKKISISKILTKLKTKSILFPVFVKPARSGSSIGVNKAHNKQELIKYIEKAFLYDSKILIEETIDGIELEIYCYRENNKIEVTPIGDLITESDFYTFEEKYLGKKVINRIPSQVNKRILLDVEIIAKNTFKYLNGEGIARIDMFLDINNNIFVNEINTIPGYIGLKENNTLIKEANIGYSKLIDILITEILS